MINQAFLQTGRGKLLAGLAAATLLCVILVVAALWHEAELSGNSFKPEPVFPNAGIALADAASLEIVSKSGTIALQRSKSDPKGGYWVMPAAHDYPANGLHIRQLFMALTDMKAVEKKTARPDWHAALSLVDPKDGGNAIAVTVKDSKGAAIAALLVGKLRPGGPNQPPLVYVRRAGENQTYLAQGDLPLETERKAWLDAGIVDIGRDRVKRVTVTPQGSPAYSVSREKPEQANFTIDNLPKGGAMLSETAANATGAAGVDLVLDDVLPESAVDFSKPSQITFETFDGLSVTLDVTDKDEKQMVRVSAQALQPSATNEANGINARTKSWAYAVPGWKATIFRKPLAQLMKTPEPSKTGTPKKK